MRALLQRAGAAAQAHRWDLLGCGLALLYGVPSAYYPFGSDQGIHWYLGHALLEGQLPYVSGISGKPPLIFVVHALAELTFGARQASIRLLELLTLPLLGYLLAHAVRRPHAALRDADVGTAALLSAAANFTYQDYWNTAHPELWMTVALVAATALALHDPRPLRRPLAVGALSMTAFLFKYPAAAPALPIALLAGWRAVLAASPAAWPRLRALLREAGLYSLGAALVFAACVLPFALSGNLRPMIEVCVDMTENYAGAVRFPRDWHRPLFDPLQQGSLVLGMGALYLAGCVPALRARRWAELALGGFGLLLALAAIASVVIQKRLFMYHWLATYPFLVWLGLWGLRQLLPDKAPLRVLAALALTVAAFAYQPLFMTKKPATYAEQTADVIAVARGRKSLRQLTLDYQRVTQADHFGDLVRASELVRSRARPGDALCLTCFISPVYELTGMRCNTRHAIGTFVPLGPRSWHIEYMRDLRERPPRFMVSIHTYPRINQDLVRRGYRQIARFGTLIVFDRQATIGH